jgi:hypothetical protein
MRSRRIAGALSGSDNREAGLCRKTSHGSRIIRSLLHTQAYTTMGCAGSKEAAVDVGEPTVPAPEAKVQKELERSVSLEEKKDRKVEAGPHEEASVEKTTIEEDSMVSTVLRAFSALSSS